MPLINVAQLLQGLPRALLGVPAVLSHLRFQPRHLCDVLLLLGRGAFLCGAERVPKALVFFTQRLDRSAALVSPSLAIGELARQDCADGLELLLELRNTRVEGGHDAASLSLETLERLEEPCDRPAALVAPVLAIRKLSRKDRANGLALCHQLRREHAPLGGVHTLCLCCLILQYVHGLAHPLARPMAAHQELES